MSKKTFNETMLNRKKEIDYTPSINNKPKKPEPTQRPGFQTDPLWNVIKRRSVRTKS